MATQFRIAYVYRFESGSRVTFDLMFDHATLDIIPQTTENLPPWTDLTYSRCRICPLDERLHKVCPVASNFSAIVEKFGTFSSHDRVQVTCTVEERTYEKFTTMQIGVSSLLGIIMTTSGCPVMAQLKPMVRFHLPFASLEETIFRMVSMYLVAQYLRKLEGISAEWSLEGLGRIYSQVEEVNRDFGTRMAGASKNDVNLNALVNLDAFAKMVPLAAEKMLKKIAPYFTELLKQPHS